MADASIKKCKSCGKSKPLTEFYLAKKKQKLSDGSEAIYEWRYGKCIGCCNENSRERYAKLRGSTGCRIDGCSNGVHTVKQGLCSAHLWRKNKYGSPTAITPREQRGLNGWKDNKGYIRHGNKFQHRLVYEEHLGRPLKKHEIVHHINGIRDDNRIENLELCAHFQPPGQRIVDKVAWAEEIIATYGPERDKL